MDKKKISMTYLEGDGLFSVSNADRRQIFVSDQDNALDCLSIWLSGGDIIGKVEGDLFQFTPAKVNQIEELEGEDA